MHVHVRVALLLAGMVLAGCSTGPATRSPSSSPPENPVVARYADTTLTFSDLQTAFRSSSTVSGPSGDSIAAYRDFLEQYVNYRLKVRAAREAGMDTLSSLRREMRSYRHKLARPRLLRKEVYDPLTRTLYERKRQEVDVSHILLRVPPDAAPDDTLSAYREMKRIADSLRRGVPFGDLAYRHSDDPSAQREGQRGFRGRLGYLRAGQIVAPFEERMYTVPPDSTSDIFRTRFGYHILKVHDRRPAEPPIRLSHILIRPDSSDAATRRLLDSLRTRIVRDSVEFATVARTYSEDRRSAPKGGDLGTVESPQSLPPSFRTAVAKLDSVGQVSPVVQSRYGYHLIQLTDRQSPQSYEEAYPELKKQIAGDPRVERRKTQFARSVRADVGVRVDTAAIRAHAPISSLDTLSRSLLSIVDDTVAQDPVVATLGDSSFVLSELARHVMHTDGGAEMSVGEVLQDFLDTKALRYAEARLARRDSTFAATMRKYRDGLLAFQFMQDSVWSVASRDTAGLRRTYRRNKETYRYPERVRTIVFRAPADSLLRPYTSNRSTRPPDVVVKAARSDSLVSVDTTLVRDSSRAPYRRVWTVADGATIGPVADDGSALLLRRDTLLPARTKTFEEARSQVIRDYQERYEDRVLRRLRAQYDVETYPGRLRAVLRRR